MYRLTPPLKFSMSHKGHQSHMAPINPTPRTPKKDETSSVRQEPLAGSSGQRAQFKRPSAFAGEDLSFMAPVAQMTFETPTRHNLGESILKTPKDKGKGRAIEPSPPLLRSAKKDDAYFQRNADRVDKRQDREDPDFETASTAESSKPSQPSKPSKKRKSTDTGSSTPSKKRTNVDTASSAAPRRPRNSRYSNVQDATRKDRDYYLTLMNDNWNNAPPHQWMPVTLMPSVRTKGKLPTYLTDPRDWNNGLLEKLAYLSRVTKGHPEIAYKAVREAVARPNRGGGGPQLNKDDVIHATKVLEHSRSADEKAVTPPPSTSKHARVDDVTSPSIGATNGEDTATMGGMTGQEADGSASLPSPRSPTLTADNIKKEPGVAEETPGAAPGAYGPPNHEWEDLTAELKEAEAELKQHEAEEAVARDRARLEKLRNRRRAMMRNCVDLTT